MKRMIRAVDYDSAAIDPSVKRAFTHMWDSVKGDADTFLSMIDRGYGNSDLDPVLLGLDYYHLSELAEQYANYRIKEAEHKSRSHQYDTEGATHFIEKLVSDYTTYPISVNIEKKKNYKNQQSVNYILYVQNEPNVSSSVNIVLEPDVKFKPSNEYIDEVHSGVDYIVDCIELRNKFISDYSELLSTFYGEYLGISSTMYKDYIKVNYYPNSNGSYDYYNVWFIYKTGTDLSKDFYKKGYIDNPYTVDLIQFLMPLFQAYNIDSLTNTLYLVCEIYD